MAIYSLRLQLTQGDINSNAPSPDALLRGTTFPSLARPRGLRFAATATASSTARQAPGGTQEQLFHGETAPAQAWERCRRSRSCSGLARGQAPRPDEGQWVAVSLPGRAPSGTVCVRVPHGAASPAPLPRPSRTGSGHGAGPVSGGSAPGPAHRPLPAGPRAGGRDTSPEDTPPRQSPPQCRSLSQ